MTYNDIISQVVRRLGVQGLTNELKADLKLAIAWAEQELITEAKIDHKTQVININSDRAEYQLPYDLSIPESVNVYTTDDVPLDHIEVTYAKWLNWNPSDSTDTSENDVLEVSGTLNYLQDAAGFTNKIVIAFTSLEGIRTLCVKPAIDGKVLIHYVPKRTDDIFADLQLEPVIPEEYHQYIIPGAVYYLAQIKSSEALAKGDEVAVGFYTRLEANAYGTFQGRKQKLIEKHDISTKSTVARTFNWYENPRKYR